MYKYVKIQLLFRSGDRERVERMRVRKIPNNVRYCGNSQCEDDAMGLAFAYGKCYVDDENDLYVPSPEERKHNPAKGKYTIGKYSKFRGDSAYAPCVVKNACSWDREIYNTKGEAERACAEKNARVSKAWKVYMKDFRTEG